MDCEHSVNYWRELLARATGSWGKFMNDFASGDKVTLNQYMNDLKSTMGYDHEEDHKSGMFSIGSLIKDDDIEP